MAAYVIQSGDTLFGIAQEYTGSGNRYREILPLNPQITNPNVIIEGNIIELPDDWMSEEDDETQGTSNLPAIIHNGGNTITVPTPVDATTKLTAGVLLALLAVGAGYIVYKKFYAQAITAEGNPEEEEMEAEDYEEEDYEIEDTTPGDEDDDESER